MQGQHPRAPGSLQARGTDTFRSSCPRKRGSSPEHAPRNRSSISPRPGGGEGRRERWRASVWGKREALSSPAPRTPPHRSLREPGGSRRAGVPNLSDGISGQTLRSRSCERRHSSARHRQCGDRFSRAATTRRKATSASLPGELWRGSRDDEGEFSAPSAREGVNTCATNARIARP